MSIAIIIPARKGSTRLPNKPLVTILGKSLIRRVWEIANSITLADDVFIATDCENIRQHAEHFDAKVIMTPDCASGTDRVAQAILSTGKSYDIVFNLQGDAPLTPPWVIEDTLKVINENPNIQLATPMKALRNSELQAFITHKKTGSLTGTTVVFDKNKNAMFFSKGIIPHYREPNKDQVIYKHIGLYAYRRDTLLRLNNMPPSTLETIEGLEQLRALENNIPIRMVEVDYKGRSTWAVDHENDVIITENIIKNEGELI